MANNSIQKLEDVSIVFLELMVITIILAVCGELLQYVMLSPNIFNTLSL
jgi:Sec-independent protein secretion pathway component TatC